MKKPIYKHPDFVKEKKDLRDQKSGKRYWLELTINQSKKETIIVIMKNPSRATKEISDKTVYNVTNYIYKNSECYKELKDIGKIIILNLIPLYKTYSKELVNQGQLIKDKNNLEIISNFSKEIKKVIIAWGNYPKGLKNEFEEIKNSVLHILNENNNLVYYVDKLSELQKNPKHGQVWKYRDPLHLYTI